MTNPTISAEERFADKAFRNLGVLANWLRQRGHKEEALTAQQGASALRQAEQAAYERAAQYIADKEERGENRVIKACASLWSAELRALAQEPEKVG